MKQISAAVLTFGLLAAPLMAEEEAPSERGLSLMERGARLFMEGILDEMEPALDGVEGLAQQMAPALRNFAKEMGPKLSEILEDVEDWNAYQAPEMLPNGDIIIRRKPDHPLVPPETPTEPEPQIEI
ncbi:hypothetical protein SAMN04488523_11215 [Sulfitobacter brevis]|uniref:AAA+ family ATPase n=1 Tax=Sulfitobacter brevis TaxID=74348 RepID=A0A1I2EDU6_9RHOB|nr:hypothetical protein [Sulfitobacter brevis]SFE91112.1 hypothetical protein SAMN04488523_11215 [Sulfitobacter brevis]